MSADWDASLHATMSACRSPCSPSPASPRSTRSAPTRSSARSPAGRSSFVGKERGEVRTDVGSLGITVDHRLRRTARGRHRPGPRRRRQPGAARGRGDARLAAPRRRRHAAGRPRSAPARWCSAPPACSTGRQGDRPLALPRAAARVRRRAGRRPLGRGRQVPDRGGRLRRDRHGAPPGRQGGRARSSPRRSSWRSSTTRSRPSTPGPRRRPRRRWSSWCAATSARRLALAA